MKELHRPPQPPRNQTSPQLRYLTANTTAAQRLRALGQIASSAHHGAYRKMLVGPPVDDRYPLSPSLNLPGFKRPNQAKIGSRTSNRSWESQGWSRTSPYGLNAEVSAAEVDRSRQNPGLRDLAICRCQRVVGIRRTPVDGGIVHRSSLRDRDSRGIHDIRERSFMVPRLAAAAVLCACAAIAAQPAFSQPTTVQSPEGLSPAYGACLARARSNTVQLGMCEQTEMAAQDARLNKAYQQVMGQLAKNPQKQMALRGEQRSWLRERDYGCKVDHQTVNSSCVVGKTASRANELEKMIRF